ncbi:protein DETOXIFICATION 24-like [Bidens hawaiensis]|uniref:protein DETOXIFICATION 24-like n=1 Tax=Bidens hawaiensis TaxID=980011 RepID=UPI0040497F70
MSSATQTLFGQSSGAGQHHMMGIHLQRSWILDLITMTIVLPILIFGTQIFKLLGQEEATANSGGYISLWMIPFCYSYVFAITIQLYLQAQLKNMIVAWLSAIQLVNDILLSLLFVLVLKLGVAGAMLAYCLSSWFVVIEELIYVFGGWCSNTWKGFTVAAFKDMVPLVKLSVFSCVMIGLELWYSGVLALLAGYLPNAKVTISAFSICLSINTLEYMICLGFLDAACIRVSNELGRGNVKAVKFAIKVLLGTSIVIGGFFFVLCLVFRNDIAYLFTNDERIANAVVDLSLLLSFSIMLNSIYPILTGVAIGAGMQSSVAIINLICFYLIGVPLAALLGYLTSLQVKGIWIGMIGGYIAQTIALSYMIWRTNWNDEVKKASERLMRFYVKSDENSEQISN